MSVAYQMLEYLKDYHNTEDTAVKARELRSLFNLTDRQLRVEVNHLRRDGEPVCSSSCGYWYSTDPSDLEKTIHRMEAQMVNMRVSITGLRKALQGGTGE